MTTMYIAFDWSQPEIRAVEVIRETKATVDIKFDGWTVSRRKDAAGSVVRPTWEEAHAWLVGIRDWNLRTAQRELTLAQSALGDVKGMKPPKD